MGQGKSCPHVLIQGRTDEAAPGLHAAPTTAQLRVTLSKPRATGQVPCARPGRYVETVPMGRAPGVPGCGQLTVQLLAAGRAPLLEPALETAQE